MTFYQRFESLVAMVITLLITIVIVVTIYRLFIEVIGGIVLGPMDPLDHRVFQTVFGEILTVLIALEFSHTLQYVAHRAAERSDEGDPSYRPACCNPEIHHPGYQGDDAPCHDRSGGHRSGAGDRVLAAP